MTIEIEDRLRRTLRAKADQIDPLDDLSFDEAPTAPRPRLLTLCAAGIVVLALLAGVLVALRPDGDDRSSIATLPEGGDDLFTALTPPGDPLLAAPTDIPSSLDLWDVVWVDNRLPEGEPTHVHQLFGTMFGGRVRGGFLISVTESATRPPNGGERVMVRGQEGTRFGFSRIPGEGLSEIEWVEEGRRVVASVKNMTTEAAIEAIDDLVATPGLADGFDGGGLPLIAEDRSPRRFQAVRLRYAAAVPSGDFEPDVEVVIEPRSAGVGYAGTLLGGELDDQGAVHREDEPQPAFTLVQDEGFQVTARSWSETADVATLEAMARSVSTIQPEELAALVDQAAARLTTIPVADEVALDDGVVEVRRQGPLTVLCLVRDDERGCSRPFDELAEEADGPVPPLPGAVAIGDEWVALAIGPPGLVVEPLDLGGGVERHALDGGEELVVVRVPTGTDVVRIGDHPVYDPRVLIALG